MSRVLVTGAGVVSPLGVGCGAFWAKLREGRATSAKPRAREGVPVPPIAATFEPAFSLEAHAPDLARPLARVSTLSQLAVLAARECLASAFFPEDELARKQGAGATKVAPRSETGVVLGTCFGSSEYHLDYHEALRRRGIKGASPLLFSESVFNAASGHVSHVHHLRGPSLTLVGGEEAGLAAIAAAFDRVSLGEGAALAGGVEQYGDLVHASCARAGLVGASPGKPFGEEPAPFAEGGALLLLEDAGEAARRGAKALACILGAGRARRGAERETTALERAAAAACREAGIAASEIDLVVTGAAGGRVAARELAALPKIVGEEQKGGKARGEPCFVCAPKGALGEGFAFTSAALALVGALALREQVVPPTVGAREATLPAPLRCVEEPLARPLRHVLVLASTLPGSAVALVLGRASPEDHAR